MNERDIWDNSGVTVIAGKPRTPSVRQYAARFADQLRKEPPHTLANVAALDAAYGAANTERRLNAILDDATLRTEDQLQAVIDYGRPLIVGDDTGDEEAPMSTADRACKAFHDRESEVNEG